MPRATLESLDDEIEWWTMASCHSKTDAALIAFGIASGLKLAKEDYNAGLPQPKFRNLKETRT